MPTSTWENLPADKQERILRAAVAEFGANGFSSGSLNVVAREAGVSKGSLFQYFDDKLDMFRHVCELASVAVRDEMLSRIEAHAADNDGLFDLLRAVLVDWVDFYREHPSERAVTFAVNFEIRDDVRRAVRATVKPYYLETIWALVEEADRRGQLRDDTSREHLVSMLLLILPHLALAPANPELEQAFDLAAADRGALIEIVHGYVDALEAAFGIR